MNAMQYKITLPNDYDMNLLRKRVHQNGKKTDGFTDLLMKAYLIIDTPYKKEYAPFYIWNNQVGMNKFIFEGFYDNILNSFGWQQINIAIPIHLDLSNNIKESKYMLEIKHDIYETTNMSYPNFSKKDDNSLGKILVYNPDKWKWVEFYFYKEIPLNKDTSNSIYEILHISM
ncbi:DUF4865 family protein [uncultured Clostridium sp.]|jgi:hypothetical protein|uniref:DUF4865 family protein n=1 Tax=uncultured Clostridium sp. TaxID=59620 RepID=UPI002630455B|nr:DUF4865 family protein [uncultured Clostridium sp.]